MATRLRRAGPAAKLSQGRRDAAIQPRGTAPEVRSASRHPLAARLDAGEAARRYSAGAAAGAPDPAAASLSGATMARRSSGGTTSSVSTAESDSPPTTTEPRPR